jgi:hypothetical protein
MRTLHILALVCMSLVFTVACSNPHSKVIPKDQTKWETELKPYIEKLSEEEKGLLVKYLMRTKMGEAFGGQGMTEGTTIGQAIAKQREFEQEQARKEQEAKLLKEKVERERAEQIKKINDVLTVAYVNKTFEGSDVMSGRYQDSIVVVFAFENKGTKDIAGFKGESVFTDMFGDKIKSVNLSYDETIPAGKSVRWTGELHYNQFMDADVKFRNTAPDKLKFTFVPSTVIFTDGSKIDMPSN